MTMDDDFSCPQENVKYILRMWCLLRRFRPEKFRFSCLTIPALNFEKKQHVQGFENTLKTWLNATVMEIKGDKMKLRWIGFTSVYDSMTSRIRSTIQEKPAKRNVIKKGNFIRASPNKSARQRPDLR